MTVTSVCVCSSLSFTVVPAARRACVDTLFTITSGLTDPALGDIILSEIGARGVYRYCSFLTDTCVLVIFKLIGQFEGIASERHAIGSYVTFRMLRSSFLCFSAVPFVYFIYRSGVEKLTSLTALNRTSSFVVFH
jgi:hypothetical protein